MVTNAAGIGSDMYSDQGRLPRSDKTGYAYTSRSFGVGASVGILDAPDQQYDNVVAYNYTEIGYLVEVSCEFNTSSQWTTKLYKDQSVYYSPSVYLCQGSTPDNAKDRYYQYTTAGESNLVCMNAHPEHVNPGGKGIVVIAAGSGSYLPLNNTQCEVIFSPFLFEVDVDLSSLSIDVLIVEHADDMDPTAQWNATYSAWNCETVGGFNGSLTADCGLYTSQGQPGLGNIATRALRQLVDLSSMQNSMYTSKIGEMFLSEFSTENGPDTALAGGNSSIAAYNQSSDNATHNRYSIEQALESLLDDTLLAFSSAQIILQNSTSARHGIFTVGGIRFGTKGYVYSLFAVNCVIVIIFFEEMLRTHHWRHMSKFDYTDIKSVVVASSMGGSGIADTVVAKHLERDTLWYADEGDRIAGAIRVQLELNGPQGSTQLVSKDDNEDRTESVEDKEETFEGSPSQGQGLFKSGPYVQVDNAEASPYS